MYVCPLTSGNLGANANCSEKIMLDLLLLMSYNNGKLLHEGSICTNVGLHSIVREVLCPMMISNDKKQEITKERGE